MKKRILNGKTYQYRCGKHDVKTGNRNHKKTAPPNYYVHRQVDTKKQKNTQGIPYANITNKALDSRQWQSSTPSRR